MSSNLNTQEETTIFTQAQYDKKVLDYGKEFYFLLLPHLTLISESQAIHKIGSEADIDFFKDIFPIFEQEAQKLYSPQDPEVELLELFFNSIRLSGDLPMVFKNINLMGLSSKKKVFNKFLPHIIERVARDVMSYSQTPLYEKNKIQKELPKNSLVNHTNKPKQKI